MSTVSPTILVLVVTIVVTATFPTAPLRAVKPPTGKCPLEATAETKLAVNLKETNRKEGIKLLEELLPKYMSNLTLNSISSLPGILKHEKEFIGVGSEIKSLRISKRLAIEEEYERKKETVHEGQKDNPLAKTINNRVSFVLNQNPPSNNLLESLWRKSHGVPLQREDLLASPQSIEKKKGEKTPRKEQSHTLDPGDESNKVLQKEYFRVVPNTFLRLKHESVVAPLQNYLTEPQGKPVTVEIYDLAQGEEEALSNILVKQTLDALERESAAVLKLDSISSLALECLLPPIDEIKVVPDSFRSTKSKLSVAFIEESDVKPVNTILNLGVSDEDSKHISYLSDYNEVTSTVEEGEDDDNVSEQIMVEIITVT